MNEAMSTDVGERIQRIIDDHREANPGIVGESITVAAPTWTWSGATGAVTGSSDPLTDGHLFRIASVTKPFVAAAILRLMEMGTVAITQPIDTYVSGDTADRLRSGGYDPAVITVRHLLSHTSGICNFADTARFVDIVEHEPQHRWTRGEQIQCAVDHGTSEGKPGTVFAYSDTGYIILGEIIERQVGTAVGPAVRSLLDYNTIGLTDTYWEQMESRPRPRPFAGAMMDGIDMTDRDHSFDLYGGGGLISTNSDLTRFFRVLFEGRVFQRRSTLAVLLTVPSVTRHVDLPLSANGVALYPVGRFIGFGHQGHWGQFAVYCPENGIAISWTTNSSGHDVSGDTVIHDIAAVLGMA